MLYQHDIPPKTKQPQRKLTPKAPASVVTVETGVTSVQTRRNRMKKVTGRGTVGGAGRAGRASGRRRIQIGSVFRQFLDIG